MDLTGNQREIMPHHPNRFYIDTSKKSGQGV